ncbi:probable serine/threonine-protein kinase DDB_G0278509 isoform X2 [Daktulosphaira vitifoliae]|nr:probable serine/threonine-protein kinase DDB_G0278509 isoform X2 [Daktulosphaira vitifoliae]
MSSIFLIIYLVNVNGVNLPKLCKSNVMKYAKDIFGLINKNLSTGTDLEDLEKNDVCCNCKLPMKIILRPCDHAFCKYCSQEIIQNFVQCPLCNTEILELDDQTVRKCLSCGNERSTMVLKPCGHDIGNFCSDKFDINTSYCPLCNQLIVDKEKCSVCLEELPIVTIKPCNHLIGNSCGNRLINSKSTCPICRSDIVDLYNLTILNESDKSDDGSEINSDEKSSEMGDVTDLESNHDEELENHDEEFSDVHELISADERNSNNENASVDENYFNNDENSSNGNDSQENYSNNEEISSNRNGSNHECDSLNENDSMDEKNSTNEITSDNERNSNNENSSASENYSNNEEKSSNGNDSQENYSNNEDSSSNGNGSNDECDSNSNYDSDNESDALNGNDSMDETNSNSEIISDYFESSASDDNSNEELHFKLSDIPQIILHKIFTEQLYLREINLHGKISDRELMARYYYLLPGNYPDDKMLVDLDNIMSDGYPHRELLELRRYLRSSRPSFKYIKMELINKSKLWRSTLSENEKDMLKTYYIRKNLNVDEQISMRDNFTKLFINSV